MSKDIGEIEGEVEPIENAGTEIMRITQEGNPDAQLAIIEKKAELAPRFMAALNKILVSQTFPEDWQPFGKGDEAKMCLGSAGAERVGRMFPIRYVDANWVKEEFTDSLGNGYRYVYSGYAEMNGRVVYAQGVYGTRDKFLGFANGEWKPLENINENSIRSAAYHIFQGNAIKALLGIRGMPVAQFQKLMGAESSKAGTAVRYGAGTQGGTSGDDSAKQKELAEICIELANAGFDAAPDGKGWKLEQLGDASEMPPMELAKAICVKISGFTSSKDGKGVPGLLASQLKGKRLDFTLDTARKLGEALRHDYPV